MTHDSDALRKQDAHSLGRQIEAGRLDPRALADVFLDAAEVEDKDRLIYARLTRKRAEAEATAAADRAKRGLRRSPLDGVPLSWKDNFDAAGIVTEAGSALLKGRIPVYDALALERATRAGMVCLGKTTMTELAYSGLGYNPHTGSPVNPADGTTPRLPGGSSGGAGVSVAAGLAPAGIGTDTGGSVRIPAAWNGLVGLKTTASRVPLSGIVPLSPTFDTVGPLTKTIPDAAALFATLAATKSIDLADTDTAPVHALAIDGDLLATVDAPVRQAYEAAIEQISRGPGKISRGGLTSLSQALDLGVADFAAEVFAIWGAAMAASPGAVFERVGERIALGGQIGGADAERSRQKLANLRAHYLAQTTQFDVVILPTVPNPAPPISEIEASADAYHAANKRALSLCSLGNRLGLCAITLPLPPIGKPALPIGLMLFAQPNEEAKLLRISATLAKRLALPVF